MKKEKIIIDTDPGHDDALAIMLLEKSRMFDILALTTVAGNSTIENVTNNARHILNLLGSNMPIYSGAAKPMEKELADAVVSGDGGLGSAVVKVKEPLTGDAVERIISLVRGNPGEISIVVIGPMTNIAQAFLQDPELPNLIKQLVIMGGAIAVPGNKNRVAEFNFFIDPEAAKIVFESKTKKILVPLDICNKTILQLSDFDKLKGSVLYEPLSKMMKQYITGLMSGEKVDGALVYDALAAYYLINPNAYSLKPMDIKIETKSELTRGMSVADLRTWTEKEFNVLVASSLDSGVFIKDFINTLKS